MAKKRDMYNQLAQRQNEKVPIKIAQHVKEFHVHLQPPKDIRRKKADGSDGSIEKVVSVIYTRIKFAGFNEAFESETVVEVDKKWTARQEVEKAFRSAVYSGLDFLLSKYEEAMAKKQADIAAAQPQTVTEPEEQEPKGGEK